MNKADQRDPPARLWSITSKIRGLEELFSMASGEPPLSEEALTGISCIFGELAEELDEIREFLEHPETGPEDSGEGVG